MATASEHLYNFHKAAHAHHSEMIAAHRTALEKAAAMEPAGGPHTTFHKSAIASHERMQAHHASAMEECSKAMAGEFEKSPQLMPTQVSTVYPATAVRAVPRNGAPAMPTPPAVDLEFQKLVDVES